MCSFLHLANSPCFSYEYMSIIQAHDILGEVSNDSVFPFDVTTAVPTANGRKRLNQNWFSWNLSGTHSDDHSLEHLLVFWVAHTKGRISTLVWLCWKVWIDIKKKNSNDFAGVFVECSTFQMGKLICVNGDWVCSQTSAVFIASVFINLAIWLSKLLPWVNNINIRIQ